MADHRIELAEQLLAKARSTGFQAERDSFVAGAYNQLGSFLGSRPALSAGSGQEPPERAVGARRVPALPPPPQTEAHPPETDAHPPEADAPPRGAEAHPPEAGTPERPDSPPALVVDLTGLEVYRAAAAHPERPRCLVDLAM